MINLTQVFFRLFLISNIIFWTDISFAKETPTSESASVHPSDDENKKDDFKKVDDDSEDHPGSTADSDSKKNSEESNNEIISFLGFKKKHSLVYLQYGSGNSLKVLSETTKDFELGYEKSETPTFKWGPYINRSSTQLNESFSYPNSGYFEKRTSAININSFGFHARRDLVQYVDITVAAGVSQSTLEVLSVDSDAPAPSTAVGYTEAYPIGLELKVGLQVAKSFSKYGLAAEMNFHETALGMSHSLSITSFNIIFRYFFNR